MALRLAAGVAELRLAQRFVAQVAGALLWSGALGVHAAGIAAGSTLARRTLIALAANLTQTPALPEEFSIQEQLFPLHTHLPQLQSFGLLSGALARGTRFPSVLPAKGGRRGLGLRPAMIDSWIPIAVTKNYGFSHLKFISKTCRDLNLSLAIAKTLFCFSFIEILFYI